MRRFLRRRSHRLGLLQEGDEDQREDEERGHEIEDVGEGHGYRLGPHLAGQDSQRAVIDQGGIGAGAAELPRHLLQPGLTLQIRGGQVLRQARASAGSCAN